MKYIFPFNSTATNVFLLINITLSYICFPIAAFILTHIICGYFPSITEYRQQFCSATAFLIVGIYSAIGMICMYVQYFRRRKKRNS